MGGVVRPIDGRASRLRLLLTGFEQLYSSASDREKKQTEIIYNKHQNRIDMQDYRAYVAYKINSK